MAKKKSESPLEDRIQSDLFRWHWNTYPSERRRLFHVNNRPLNKIDGARMKAMGMVAGVSDLCFICGDGTTAYIEMKTPTGTQSPAQKLFEAAVRSVGAPYYIVRSVEEGMELIEKLR